MLAKAEMREDRCQDSHFAFAAVRLRFHKRHYQAASGLGMAEFDMRGDSRRALTEVLGDVAASLREARLADVGVGEAR